MSSKPDDDGPGKPRNPQRQDYEVGYRKPPKAYQFKPGGSGNPSGERRRKVSMKAMFEEEFLRKITAREGDRVITLTKASGMFKRLMADGLMGDKAAIRLAFNIAAKFGVGEVKQAVEGAFTDADEAILDAYLKKRAAEEK
jgi:hypothetical protein